MADIVKISISNSALDRFAQCPLSYFHSYLNPERPKQEGVNDFYANYGTLIHFFSEMYPRTVHFPEMEWKGNKEKSAESMDNVLNSYGNMLMEQKVVLDIPKMMTIYDELFPLINFPKEETRDEYYKQGVKYIEKLPTMDWSKVVGLEKYFRDMLDPNIASPITGLIDKVERDEGGLIVTDYKTSKPYSVNAIMAKNQLPMYGLACYMMYGEFPYKYRYHFTRFDKIVEVEIPQERLKQVKNTIMFRYMQILSYHNAGKFPAQYQDFYCKNFCGYSRMCPTFKAFNPSSL
jgi:CRISPR/Cas system-associated exonuclease Cas4 (RecB family)